MNVCFVCQRDRYVDSHLVPKRLWSPAFCRFLFFPEDWPDRWKYYFGHRPFLWSTDVEIYSVDYFHYVAFGPEFLLPFVQTCSANGPISLIQVQCHRPCCLMSLNMAWHSLPSCRRLSACYASSLVPSSCRYISSFSETTPFLMTCRCSSRRLKVRVVLHTNAWILALGIDL